MDFKSATERCKLITVKTAQAYPSRIEERWHYSIIQFIIDFENPFNETNIQMDDFLKVFHIRKNLEQEAQNSRKFSNYSICLTRSAIFRKAIIKTPTSVKIKIGRRARLR